MGLKAKKTERSDEECEDIFWCVHSREMLWTLVFLLFLFIISQIHTTSVLKDIPLHTQNKYHSNKKHGAEKIRKSIFAALVHILPLLSIVQHAARSTLLFNSVWMCQYESTLSVNLMSAWRAKLLLFIFVFYCVYILWNHCCCFVESMFPIHRKTHPSSKTWHQITFLKEESLQEWRT